MERAQGQSLDSNAARRATPVVLCTVVLASVFFVLVVRGDPVVDLSSLYLAATLAALGLGAEFLSFNTAKNTSGSIALVPFAAALLVAPSSIGIVLVVLAEGIAHAATRRPWLKWLFNVAHGGLAFSVGLLAYRLTGGVAFGTLSGVGFLECAKVMLLSTTCLVLGIFVVNSAAMGAVVAATAQRPYLPVIAQISRASAPFLFLLVLVAFYLTWLSVNLGVLGTAGMVIPMIAVRQLFRTTTELTNVTEELLDLMVAAIEARDPYTSGHSKRVARASEIIARAVGLSARQVERVTVAALLHDVGKIDEAFAKILAKEGRLTPEEWEIMKRHPVRGAELVGMLSSLKDLVEPVLHHHENWDGTGYPTGLRGDQIPLASRIIMFADTLDAITTDRPYRKALGMEEARSEFVKFRGRQFDPTICDRVVSPQVWDELYTSFGTRATEKVAATRAS